MPKKPKPTLFTKENAFWPFGPMWGSWDWRGMKSGIFQSLNIRRRKK